jgi:hypothetical protein
MDQPNPAQAIFPFQAAHAAKLWAEAGPACCMHSSVQQPSSVTITGSNPQQNQPRCPEKSFHFPEINSNFQNSYLLKFKPKSSQTSSKTILNSSSIYLKYSSY